jgi:hypothetical protein
VAVAPFLYLFDLPLFIQCSTAFLSRPSLSPNGREQSLKREYPKYFDYAETKHYLPQSIVLSYKI